MRVLSFALLTPIVLTTSMTVGLLLGPTFIPQAVAAIILGRTFGTAIVRLIVGSTAP